VDEGLRLDGECVAVSISEGLQGQIMDCLPQTVRSERFTGYILGFYDVLLPSRDEKLEEIFTS
jgi:hypothetical protein